MSFTALGLSNLLAETIKTLHDQPTTLQEQAIPIILQNNDLMVAAQTTGTGKIDSFALPIIEKLFPNGDTSQHTLTPKQTKALILVASQDEAIQISDYFKAYSFDFPLNIASVLDNVSIAPQIKILGRGVDVLIANPNRLLELLVEQAIDLSAVKVFVLDEAEQLTNDATIRLTKQIIEKLPAERQNLIYASSFTDDVIVLAHFLLKNPERIEINITQSFEHIKQSVFYIPTRQKPTLLVHLITKHWPQLIVFTRTKYGANRLVGYLNKRGITSITLHNNKNETIREKALNDFKAHTLRVLVVTDLTPQSLELTDFPCIVNFDLPYIENDYIQRITALNTDGEMASFVSPEEEKLLLVIENFINQKIADGDIQDFVFDETELTNQEPDRFKRIFRHPAVGRKSRQRKPSFLEEQSVTPPSEEQDIQQQPTRTTKSPYNRIRKNTTRTPYNKHRRNDVTTAPIDIDNLPPDRPEDEFRDDDYDNFGNSVDYVSPYPPKNKSTYNRQPTRNTTQATPTHTATTTNRTYKPRTQRTSTTSRNTETTSQEQQRRPRNSLYRRNNRTNNAYSSTTRHDRDVVVTTPTPIASEFKDPTPKRSTTTPAIIHRKHPRLERLPTLEQLDSLPNRHITKSEKPALLSRKNDNDE